MSRILDKLDALLKEGKGKKLPSELASPLSKKRIRLSDLKRSSVKAWHIASFLLVVAIVVTCRLRFSPQKLSISAVDPLGSLIKESTDATASLKSGRYTPATLQNWTHLAEALPQVLEARINLALALKRSGDWVGARALLGDLLKIKADSGVILNNLGMIDLEHGFFLRAVDFLEAAAQAEPTDLRVRLNLARAHERAKMFELAIRDYAAISTLLDAKDTQGMFPSAKTYRSHLSERVRRLMSLAMLENGKGPKTKFRIPSLEARRPAGTGGR